MNSDEYKHLFLKAITIFFVVLIIFIVLILLLKYLDLVTLQGMNTKMNIENISTVLS